MGRLIFTLACEAFESMPLERVVAGALAVLVVTAIGVHLAHARADRI